MEEHYWIEDGALHIDVPALLKEVGLHDSEENRDLAVDILVQIAKEQFPHITCKVVRGDR